MQPVIQEVLAVCSVWNGAIEREYIQRQQKPAPPLPVVTPPRVGVAYTKPRRRPRTVDPGLPVRDRVLLAIDTGSWWTAKEVAQALGISTTQAHTALHNLTITGYLEHEFEGRKPGRSVIPQRYRVAL